MATVGSFQTRFPEFCHVNDARVQMFLDDTELLMAGPAKWLGFYDVAHEYHTAHLLIIASHQEMGESGVSGPIVHKEVDDVVIKKAITSISPTMDDFYSTSYGKRYLHYRRICFAGVYGV